MRSACKLHFNGWLLGMMVAGRQAFVQVVRRFLCRLACNDDIIILIPVTDSPQHPVTFHPVRRVEITLMHGDCNIHVDDTGQFVFDVVDLLSQFDIADQPSVEMPGKH